MKIIARFVISLEKLIKNPVNWFSQQHWWFRMILVFSIVPLISAVSIFSYQKYYFKEMAVLDSSEVFSQEINELREVVEKFHNSQMEELYYLSEIISESHESSSAAINRGNPVLGVEDLRVTDNLRDRLENSSLSDEGAKLIYIKPDVGEVDVFASPSSTSLKLTTLSAGSFHPSLAEEENWQEVYLDDGEYGWIKKEFITKPPINENN